MNEIYEVAKYHSWGGYPIDAYVIVGYDNAKKLADQFKLWGYMVAISLHE